MDARTANATRILAGCVAGVAAGMGLGFVMCRRSFDARLDQEVAALKEHYSRAGGISDDSPDREDQESAAVDSPDWSADARLLSKADRRFAQEHLQREADEGLEGLSAAGRDQAPDAVWPPVDRDHTRPYVISAEEFAETDIGWQQLTITFYAADGVLADDKDQPIRDVFNTVGAVNRLTFGGVSRDPSIMFVRNERLEIDFEIVLNRQSYSDVVLNYGNPDRKDQ